MELDLDEVEATDNKVKRFYCCYKECGASFGRKFRLDRHLRSHRNERPFVCDIGDCKKAFTCPSYLSKHKKRPHAGNDDDLLDGFKKRLKREKRYNCEVCLKELKSKFLLKAHLAQHTGDKPFKCNKCELGFAVKQNLLRHQKTHQGYKCDRDDCNFIAEKWSLLRKHVAINHKTIHQCNECGQVLSSKFKLRLHVKNHKFFCTVDDCDKKFTRKIHLKNHINSCHTGPLVSCPHLNCDKKFCNDIVLAQHTLSHLNLNNNNNVGSLCENQRLQTCKKIFAELLSGHQANELEKAAIKNTDKDYRNEMTIFV